MSISIYFNSKTKTAIDSGINMSNGNFVAVANALGIQFDWDMPPMDIHKFIDAMNRYLKSEIDKYVDNGVEPTRDESGNVMDCGRREGYITERVVQVLNVTIHAQLKGAHEVYFC